MKKPFTPELDKISESHDQTQAAGGFLDWLITQENITLCRYHDGLMEDGDEDIDNPEGWYPYHRSIQAWLAEWRDIDQDVAEKERVALLEWIRQERESK